MYSYTNYYPVSNSEIISQLGLLKHPEGGYFKETDRQTLDIPSPFANNEPRPLATSIYYLITYEERAGKFHMNNSVTYHVLHHGRAEYTLIHPSSPGTAPRIEKVIMGTNVAAGETRQLLVGGGVWKMSSVPKDDIDLVNTDESKDKDRIGCLITEVVTPGFDWQDHKYMTQQNLEKLFEGIDGADAYIQEFSQFVKE